MKFNTDHIKSLLDTHNYFVDNGVDLSQADEICLMSTLETRCVTKDVALEYYLKHGDMIFSINEQDEVFLVYTDNKANETELLEPYSREDALKLMKSLSN